MSQTELFLQLTPDWVIRAVEAAGLEPTGHCLGLHCLENRVYDLMLEDRTHVVAKFYRPGRWSKSAIEEEHAFLFDLVDGEVPVCAPMLFADGRALHEVEGIHYAVWPRTGGRSPTMDELDDGQVAILGRLLARLHNVGAGKTLRHRVRLDADTYVRQPVAYLKAHGFLPPQLVNRYEKAALSIADLYDSMAASVPAHRIHGDCHHGNLLLGRDGWFFLDFDDCVLGPAVQDVWMLLPGRDDEGLRQRRLFIEAYQTFRDFDPAWLRLVEPLRALRFVHYAAWIARRWKDPAFSHYFPDFNTERYWQTETTDLEDQLGRCRESAAPGF
ncbi:MAG: serine/threonine protein kinase [Deltaproteobacteria bacterium]|nr:serine/threonine protein kinase [Deltaproteobacteria bacterium]